MPPGDDWLRRAAASWARQPPPERFEEIDGSADRRRGARVVVGPEGEGVAILEDLADAGVEVELPAPRAAVAADR